MSRVKPALLTRIASGPRAALGGGDQRLGRSGLAQIGGADRHALAEFGRERLERRLAGAGECYGAALGVDGAGDGAPDAAGGAGDEGGLATQIKHGMLPQL